MPSPETVPPTNLNAALRLSAAPPFRFVVVAGLVGLAAVLATRAVMPGAGSAATAVPAAGMACVALLGARALRGGYPHARLGACNAVTLVRSGVVAVLATALALPGGVAPDPALAWMLVALALIGLALDGADGWLARRSGLSSAFGARFDMEVDAALAAVLCLLAILSGKAGLWLLPLGFLRYAWVVAGWAIPWLDGPLPDRRSRKTVCVLQIAVLIALLAPAVLPPVSTVLAATATVALLWSFGRDALWRWRHRG